MHPRLPERLAMCVVAAVATVLNVLLKLPCTVPGPPDVPRGAFVSRYGCWSDVAALWNSRQLVGHVFPYVTGSQLGNGTVEYPTLTGVWVWLTALPVGSAHGFLLVTGAVAGVLAVVVTLLLVRVAGRRAWIWAATPPLALYAAYNWDLLAVVCTVAGLVVMLRPPSSWSTTTRYAVAGLAFGLGGAFKLYPLMFLAPLAIAALLDQDAVLRVRVRRTVAALGSGVGVVLAANVPFVLVNAPGWLSVFEFQASRPIGASTMSVWYYGLLPWSADLDGPAQQAMGTMSTLATALGIIAVLVVTVVLARRRGSAPWVQSAAALLAVYMVCNKVASPQYVLWLLPFLVVVRISGWWIGAYLVADVCAVVGFFRNTYYQAIGAGTDTWAYQAMTVGIWGRAALLVVFVVFFLRSTVVTRPPGPNTLPVAVRGTVVTEGTP
ncbi:hypothetical protein [Curtobacterium sp. VKM Ac-2922]|uniref:hypothetical protein n=1 Tax=Curtobacterium sp. VKM Ac-2922 TaxID=2929475 RepID=UPI001FB4C8EF|nr:hypothetical protein [Curtobacterium sp. VKM Ac-2922]MCJ1713351.1 hypothetical protein [Curtobacterium sp. VKM Ac-2922]